MSRPSMIAPERAWVYAQAGDDWASLARRELPNQPLEQAVADLQSWNLYLAFRSVPAVMTSTDIVFIEPPPAS